MKLWKSNCFDLWNSLVLMLYDILEGTIKMSFNLYKSNFHGLCNFYFYDYDLEGDAVK